MQMKKLIVPLIILSFVFTACDKAKIFEKYLDNERITWNRFDVKTFQVPIVDVSSSYDFYVAIRHVDAFPLDFLHLKFIISTPSGETRSIEQKIMLRNKDGKWLGDGMGDLWDVSYLFRKGLKITEPGTCTVEISSAMSQADLPGIMQVGLVVRKGN
jgi:gliding motility-associated lipoprotein GldH